MRVIDFRDASCRHCYKCVRNCEVKAISVENEQAHIMKDHCINCGHCLEVAECEDIRKRYGPGKRVSEAGDEGDHLHSSFLSRRVGI